MNGRTDSESSDWQTWGNRRGVLILPNLSISYTFYREFKLLYVERKGNKRSRNKNMRTSLGVSPVHKFSSALTFFYYYTAESANRKMKRNPCPNWLTDWAGSTFPQLVSQEKSFFFWPHNKSALIDQARSVKMAASLFFVFLSTPTIKRRKTKKKTEKNETTATTWPIFNHLDDVLGDCLHGGGVPR